MSTIRQKLAAKEVVNGSNYTNAMKKAGYSVETAKRTNKLTNTKGFKQELENYGLTPELIKSSLVEDIKKKKHKRVGELALGADILKLRDNKVQVNILNIGQVLDKLEKENG